MTLTEKNIRTELEIFERLRVYSINQQDTKATQLLDKMIDAMAALLTAFTKEKEE